MVVDGKWALFLTAAAVLSTGPLSAQTPQDGCSSPPVNVAQCRELAEAGDAVAQYSLGVMYADGVGGTGR